LTAGESHGPCLTTIIEGLPSGLPLSAEDIGIDLRRRQQGYGRGGRMAIEHDQVQIVGGVIDGQTTGAPVALTIDNRDWANWRDRQVPPWTVPRPGHADLAGSLKYGLHDMRWIAERASARGTAIQVAVGAVSKRLLGLCGLTIGSYVTELGNVAATVPDLPLLELWALAEASDVRCPDPQAAEAMRQHIEEARAAGDSLGGVFVVSATGVPVGLGSHVHWDRRLDGRVAQATMSIPAIKGVEIGPAFENARRRGTEVHDQIEPQDAEHSIAPPQSGYPAVTRRTNRAGGIEGGTSNGQPIIVRAAMKPIPTTVTPLRSVDMATGQPSATQYQRSDVCALPAACVVAEAMLAWVLAEALVEKFGADSLSELLRNLQGYRQAIGQDTQHT
jgi:chorismate synthase